MKLYLIFFVFNEEDLGLGIGDWGLGIGVWDLCVRLNGK